MGRVPLLVLLKSLNDNFMNALKLILFLFLTNIIIVKAQPPKKFSTHIGGNGYDCGNDLKLTLDNCYIITGNTSSYGRGNTDLYLLKVDSFGTKIFEKTFGNFNNESGSSIVQLVDSSYVIAGYTNSTGFGGYDLYIVKTDKNGELLWEKTIGGSDWDFANSICVTNDGGMIIAGTTYSFGKGNADGYVIKLDDGGNVLWSKTYGGKNDDEFKSVIQTIDGGYALTGYTKSYNDSTGNVWVFKLDLQGDSTWCKFYGGNKEDFGNQITETQTGEFFIAGATASSVLSNGTLNAYALKIASNGVLLNEMSDGTNSFNEIYTSVVISNRTSNNIICFSEKESFPGYDLQIKTIEFTFDFNYLNASDHGSIVADETFKIIATKDKGYACIGYTNGFSSVLKDCYFIKIDSTIIGGPNYVSVPELNANNFHFSSYPNPAKNSLTIQSNVHLNKNEISLYDITGNEVFIKEFASIKSENTMQINLENFSNGVYYLKYRTHTEKILVIH
jgi:hypothetical protein